MQRAINRTVGIIATAAAAYGIPPLALAFATGAGPVLGVMF